MQRGRMLAPPPDVGRYVDADGTEVEVLDSVPGRYRVRIDGVTLWVSADYWRRRVEACGTVQR